MKIFIRDFFIWICSFLYHFYNKKNKALKNVEDNYYNSNKIQLQICNKYYKNNEYDSDNSDNSDYTDDTDESLGGIWF